MNIGDEIKLAKMAQEKMDDVYKKYFPYNDAPTLSAKMVSVIVETAVEMGLIIEVEHA